MIRRTLSRIYRYFFPVVELDPQLRPASDEAGEIALQLAQQIARDESIDIPLAPAGSSPPCPIIEVGTDYEVPGFGELPSEVQEMGGVGVAVFLIRPTERATL